MRHIKTMHAGTQIPRKAAMSTETILYIVGSAFTAIGTVLITVSSSIGPKDVIE